MIKLLALGFESKYSHTNIEIIVIWYKCPQTNIGLANNVQKNAQTCKNTK